MRVLHAIGEMGTGGAESLVTELVLRGPDVGWHSEVASSGGHREDELVAHGVPVHRVPLSRRRPQGLARAVLATRRAIRLARPDVVVAHNVGVTAAVYSALRSLNSRIPLVTVFHGVAAADYRTSARLLSRAPDVVVTVSATIADRLAAAGLNGREIVVVPNAVTRPDTPPRDVARAGLDLGPATPVALCAARLVEQKRHDVLLRAWALTPPDAVLLLAGDGPYRERLEELAGTLGLGDRVRFLGARRDVPALLGAADVFTLSSDWEGLPVALLEAMAAERPVVATGVDGVVEVLRHGGGLIVPPGDPQSLATALSTLLGDGERARALGRDAGQVIRAHYDPATLMRSYDRLLRSLTNLPGAPSASPSVDDGTTGSR